MTTNRVTPIVLNGPKFNLRPFLVEQVSDLYVSWLNDPEVNRFLEVRFVKQTIELARKYVHMMNYGVEAYMWAIYPNGVNAPVGTATLRNIDRNHSSGGIGLMIGDKNYWGSDCAMEAIRLVIDHAFDALGLRRLAEETSGPNHSINFTLKRLGFTFEGKMRQASVTGPGEYCDGYRWGLLVDEWNAKKEQHAAKGPDNVT